METISAKEFRAGRAHRVISKPLDGCPVEFGALFLTTIPPSANNIFVNSKKGRFKSPEYKAWQARACGQLRRQDGWHVPGPIRVRMIFAKAQTKADCDNLIKPTLDILMAAGRIADDRNVVEVRAAFESDAVGTRIEIYSASRPIPTTCACGGTG